MDNTTVNFNKIVSILKSTRQTSLELEIRAVYTPSLWGNRLLLRSSFEGRIIDFLREMISLDNCQKKWKRLFREVFAQIKSQELAAFSSREQSELYALKFSYAKKNSDRPLPSKKAKPHLDPHKKPKTEHSVPLHWTKDPVELKKLSLLRTWTLNQEDPSVDTEILTTLFGMNHQNIYENKMFFEKILSYTQKSLENKTPAHRQLASILKQGNFTEEKLQEIIDKGRARFSVTESLPEITKDLKKLSEETCDALAQLKADEGHLIFGGILARAPKLNISDAHNSDILKKFENFLDPIASQAFLKKLTNDICTFIDQEAHIPQVTEEFAAKTKLLLKEGLISFAFPKLKTSLFTEEQSLSAKALLALPELLRYGTDKALSFAEAKILEDTAESFSAIVSKDFCLELINSALDKDIKEALKQKLQLHLENQLSHLRHTLLLNFTSLAGGLPALATDMVSACGYGDIGCPESPLWFEIIRQQNGKFSLQIYATGQTAVFQGAVPLKYENLNADQLNADFFLRLYSYRAWPKWDLEIHYNLIDVYQVLLASLKTEPTASEDNLQELESDLHNTPGAWGLIKALICTHCPFASKIEKDLFFFNWKKKSLLDLWVKLGTNQIGSNENISLKNAAEALANEALELFEVEALELNDLKAVYATTREILETLIEASPPKVQHKKTSIIPPELNAQVRAFFDNMPTKSSKDSFLIKKILVDILGKKVEPALNEILNELYPEPSGDDNVISPKLPEAPSVEKPCDTLKRLGRKFTNILLDLTIGINLDDLTANTFFSYIKIAGGVARIAYSIFFSQLALALNLRWAVSYVAVRVLSELAEACFPKQVIQLRQQCDHYQKVLEEWRLRLVAYAAARLLFNAEQREAFTDLIKTWQAHLTNGGKISFDIPEAIPEQKTLFFRKVVLQYPTRHAEASTPQIKNRPTHTPAISPKNCLKFLNDTIETVQKMLPGLIKPESKSLKFDKTIKLDQSNQERIEAEDNRIKAFIYVNEQFRALPVPLSTDQSNFWSQVKNPQLHLEKVATLAWMLYSFYNDSISSELKTQKLIHLYKAYAIIDNLARRCPEAELEGYKVNPWALALIKKNAFFRIIDPRMQIQMEQVCTYFGIDILKDYTDSDIYMHVEESLFFGNNSSNSIDNYNWLDDNYLDEFLQQNFHGPQATISRADQRYYNNLLKKAEIQQKLIKLGLSPDAHHIEKFALLYADGKRKTSMPFGEYTSPSEKLLPRPFSLLRLVNLLANEYTQSFFNCSSSTTINTIDDFPAAFVEHDSCLRQTLNFLTGERFFKKNNTWLLSNNNICLNHVEAQMEINGTSNAAFRSWILPDGINYFTANYYQQRKFHHLQAKNRSFDGSSFSAIITNYLHFPSRVQNTIINESPNFNTKRKELGFFSYFSKVPKETIVNILEQLPEKERVALELIWADETDQAVRTLAYFSQRIEHLNKIEFFLLFEILLLRSNVLEHQLKTAPSFAHTLGDFFTEATVYYTDDINTSKTLLDLIEIGIYALAKSTLYNPRAKALFPDFSKILRAICPHKPQVSPFKIAYLLRMPHYFKDPASGSVDEQKSACHDYLQSLLWLKSDNQAENLDIFAKWIPSIAQILNESTAIRNEVLNELAWKEKLIPSGQEVSWSGTYPAFYSGIITLDVKLDAFCRKNIQPISKEIQEALTEVYEEQNNKVYFNEGRYCGIKDRQLTIDIKPINSNQEIELLFRKCHNGITYRWVKPINSTDKMPGKITYWLEEKSDNRVRRLLVLDNGEVKNIQFLDKKAKQNYAVVTPIANTENDYGDKIDLTIDAHGLDLLAWFQPLSTINATRSLLPPYGLRRLEFTALGLTFNIGEIDGKRRAISTGCAEGFYIAEEQRPVDKLPILNNHTCYLLLENQQKQHRIILPAANLRGATASWLMKKKAQLTSSRLMDATLNNMTPFLTTPESKNDFSAFFVYAIDEQGLLISDDSTALLHLLLHAIANEQWADMSSYLILIEGIGKRMKYPPEVLHLIQYIEMAAMVLDDPAVLRIALRLAAVREENTLVQSESNESPTLNEKETFLSWLSTQVNFYRHLKQPKNLPHLPLDEYQELFILHDIAKKGKELMIKGGALTNIQDQKVKVLLEMINLDNLSETFLMPSETSQRYAFLKHKYAFKDEYKTSLTTFMREVVQEQLLNESPSLTAKSIFDTSQLETTSTKILPGMQESAIKRLLTYLTNSKQSFQSLLHQYNNDFLDKELLSDNFCSQYRMALDYLPNDLIDQTAKAEEFKARAATFRKELIKNNLAQKLTNEKNAITAYLLRAVNPKLHIFYPDPDKVEKQQKACKKLSTAIDTCSHEALKIKTELLIRSAEFSDMMLLANYKAYAHIISTEWEEVPVLFEELSLELISSHFFAYYQLAMEKPPLKCLTNKEKNNAFMAKATRFKKALLLAQGKNPGEKLLLEILRYASEGGYLTPFPDPHTIEKKLLDYIAFEEAFIVKSAEIKNAISFDEQAVKKLAAKKEVIKLGFLNSPVYHFVSSLENAYKIASALPSVKNYLISFAKQQGTSMLLMGGSSLLTSTFGFGVPAAICSAKTAYTVYKGIKILDALQQKYVRIIEKQTKAKVEKLEMEEKNQIPETRLPINWCKQLNDDDNSLKTPLQNLLKKHFKDPSPNSKKIDQILLFACPSKNPIVIKAFSTLNQSLDDFYARPSAEATPEEFYGIENYYQLKFELTQLKKLLAHSLKTAKKKLLATKTKINFKAPSDHAAITASLKESTLEKNSSSNKLGKEARFNALMAAFVANSHSELMRCASCEEIDLPQIKLQLYRFLIKMTRLQQIERALAIQTKIDPAKLEDAEMKIRLKQLTFELARKRAYSFTEELPTKLFRGYLAFEYGSGMMLWEKQVKQLQQMLLSEHERSILELIMGSGKTVFGTPMISFFGSNGKQVIANFFPDALASENIKDLSSRSLKFFGQTANAFKISRETPLDEENLWALQRILMRATDQKESLNACKKDFQALQLLFIEEAHKAIQKEGSVNESLLWSYMQLLGSIRKNVRGNIDEAHRLLRYNDELNHPLGEKKKVKQSYVNVISECMRLLVAIPEIKANIPLETNDQTLCSTEKYHNHIKPLLAEKLSRYRPFTILPEQRKIFIEYLCGKLEEIPGFVLSHPRYSEIGLAVGVLNKFLPDALQKKINVHFGTKGNPHGYAQPYSSKDTPIEGSTFKNPYEAVLKTLMASLHSPLNPIDAELLICIMKSNAEYKVEKDGTHFENTHAARLFKNWTGGKYLLKDMLPANKCARDDLTELLNRSYAPRMTYARLKAIPKIEYFSENLCCNSQNFASLFSSFYAATATPAPEEICPTSTKILWDPGTAGEFIDHICRTCNEDHISELNSRAPHEALQELLASQFRAGTNKRALIDSGSLLYGLSNEAVAEGILEHIAANRPDLLAVVYFNSQNELVIQEKDKRAVSLANSSIPMEKRITYFDQSHTFGADIPQAIATGGEVSIGEKTNFEEFMQASWRMRGLKTAQQQISVLVNTAAKKVITTEEKLHIRDVITFTKHNEALNQEEGFFPSAQQKVDDVIRTAVYDLMLNSTDVTTMLDNFRKFSYLFVSTSDEDPGHYGAPEVEVDAKKAFEELCKLQFRIIKESYSFSTSEKDAIWRKLLQIGEESTFPEKVKLYKKNGKLVSRQNDLGMAQHVSLQVAQKQSQNQEASRHQNTERNQNLEREQNQDLQLDICSQKKPLPKTHLRIDLAPWDETIDYFASLAWFDSYANGDYFNHARIKLYSVEESLRRASSENLSDIAKAFYGDMYWSNNLQGILATGSLAEPCSKKQMLELLVLQGPASNNIITCAIDQEEARFWRNQLAANRTKAKKMQPVKIALFDIVLNKIVASGKNTFNEKLLHENRQFNFDIARWRFLAGQVNLQKGSELFVNRHYSLLTDFSKWLEDYNIENMKKAYTSIYKSYGFGNLANSHMQRFFSISENEAIPELL